MNYLTFSTSLGMMHNILTLLCGVFCLFALMSALKQERVRLLNSFNMNVVIKDYVFNCDPA
jgi:hypothetical protein